MSIFDKLKAGNQADQPQKGFDKKMGSETFHFQALPENLDELKALPEAVMDTPFKTAALTVCALCAYAADQEIGIEMLNFLSGPRPLSNYDKTFLRDRFMDGKYYVPFSYFKGAVPENNYEPEQPFTITIETNPYSYDNEGYAKLFIASGGADSPRPLTLRMRGEDGKWFLWEQLLLAGIRTPKKDDPWA